MTPESETVPGLLAARAARDGALDALVADGEAITYGELDATTAELAARLVGAGVDRGDRVGLLAPNGVEWAVLAYAVMRIGAVLVPLSTLLRPPELRAHLAIADVAYLITVPAFRGRRYLDDLAEGDLGAAAPALRAVWRTDDLPARSSARATVDAMSAAVLPDDDLVVLFTSGSTGDPKGCIHTHGGGIRATAAGLDARCVGRGERLYIPMPFFWTGGFSSGLLSTLIAGATLLTEAEPEPERTLALLQRERVTLFRGWPDQAVALAAHPAFATADLSSLGDGSLPALLPAERRPAPGARPNLFGMTETFGPYCGDRLDTDLPAAKRGSCGRPFAGVHVRIADPDTGVPLAAGERGEIWVRGANILRGMCGRPDATLFTADGWYRTGDEGRLDEDGYLWSTGRLDDMFKVKGATVYPSEVEAALRAVDGVRQAHVTDVVGDGGWREVGAAVVTDAPRAEVAAAVRLRLSAFKVPTRWLMVAEPSRIPMTATGKVDKAALRALLERTDEGEGA